MCVCVWIGVCKVAHYWLGSRQLVGALHLHHAYLLACIFVVRAPHMYLNTLSLPHTYIFHTSRIRVAGTVKPQGGERACINVFELSGVQTLAFYWICMWVWVCISMRVCMDMCQRRTKARQTHAAHLCIPLMRKRPNTVVTHKGDCFLILLKHCRMISEIVDTGSRRTLWACLSIGMYVCASRADVGLFLFVCHFYYACLHVWPTHTSGIHTHTHIRSPLLDSRTHYSSW